MEQEHVKWDRKIIEELRSGYRWSDAIFACGADMKNRFSFFKDGQIYLSYNNGDLADYSNFARFLASIKEMKEELGVFPDVVAYDLHPGYYSSRARDIFSTAESFGVQHHHAHIAGVMAQNKHEKVIGVSFDGTGYGLDGNIWGGEFLLVGRKECIRRGHLGYMKMPGADMAVRHPWRMAFSLLYGCLGDKVYDTGLEFLKLRPRNEFETLKAMIDKSVNVCLTSSAGRLFDAVSSILGIKHSISFEAEAAIRLEQKAQEALDCGGYVPEIVSEQGIYTVKYDSLVRGILLDLQNGIAIEAIARRFHDYVVNVIVSIVKLISIECRLSAVALSGGVFQNKLLYEKVCCALAYEGFSVLDNELPVNDLGICVGQTYVALNRSVFKLTQSLPVGRQKGRLCV